jgi:hypothetical protein
MRRGKGARRKYGAPAPKPSVSGYARHKPAPRRSMGRRTAGGPPEPNPIDIEDAPIIAEEFWPWYTSPTRLNTRRNEMRNRGRGGS